MIDIREDVIIGKDGVLFLHNGGHFQMDYLIGKKEPSVDSIKHFKQNILEPLANSNPPISNSSRFKLSEV